MVESSSAFQEGELSLLRGEDSGWVLPAAGITFAACCRNAAASGTTSPWPNAAKVDNMTVRKLPMISGTPPLQAFARRPIKSEHLVCYFVHLTWVTRVGGHEQPHRCKRS